MSAVTASVEIDRSPDDVFAYAVGVTLVRRSVPKFGLAYAAVTGALAVGQLLIELYRGSSSTARPVWAR